MSFVDTCLAARKSAADGLHEALEELLESPDKFSEVDLRNLWLAKLRRNKSLFPDGWYTPPPHGIILKFATDSDTSRLAHQSNRVPESWPRPDVYFDRQHGLIAAYASQVDRATGMIGDFGVTLYVGDRTDIHKHFRATFDIEQQLFDDMEVGQPISSIATNCAQLLHAAGLRNEVLSVNDPTKANLGHSFPGSGTGLSQADLATIQDENRDKAAALISSRRVFVNSAQSQPIPTDGILTIEPRASSLTDPATPQTFFHTLAVMRAGQKEWITGFDSLFDLAGMDYMR